MRRKRTAAAHDATNATAHAILIGVQGGVANNAAKAANVATARNETKLRTACVGRNRYTKRRAVAPEHHVGYSFAAISSSRSPCMTSDSRRAPLPSSMTPRAPRHPSAQRPL
jgi:hypothetical protein